MINNEFHLIGVATSGFIDISNGGSFIKHKFTMEIEKQGSKTGSVINVECEVYGTNKAIDTNWDIAGRTICVNGYIDSYTFKGGEKPTMKLICQNLLILSKKPSPSNYVAKTELPQQKDIIENDSVVDPNGAVAEMPFNDDIPDDDLPF